MAELVKVWGFYSHTIAMGKSANDLEIEMGSVREEKEIDKASTKEHNKILRSQNLSTKTEESCA